MKIERRDVVNGPAEQAFLVLRDRMSEFIAFLPNIERIEVQERKEIGEKVDTTIRWYAKAEIPDVAKKFVKPEYLSWLDTATWDKSDLSIEYSISSPMAKGLLTVTGRNQMIKKSEVKDLERTKSSINA